MGWRLALALMTDLRPKFDLLAWIDSTGGTGDRDQRLRRLMDAREPEGLERSLSGALVARYSRGQRLRRLVVEHFPRELSDEINWDTAITTVAFDLVQLSRQHGLLQELLLVYHDDYIQARLNVRVRRSVLVTVLAATTVVALALSIGTASEQIVAPTTAGTSTQIVSAAGLLTLGALWIWSRSRPLSRNIAAGLCILSGVAIGVFSVVNRSDLWVIHLTFKAGWCDVAQGRLDRAPTVFLADPLVNLDAALCEFARGAHVRALRYIEPMLDNRTIYEALVSVGWAYGLHIVTAMVLMSEDYEHLLATTAPRRQGTPTLGGRTAIEHLTLAINFSPTCSAARMYLGFALASQHDEATIDSVKMAALRQFQQAHDLSNSAEGPCKVSSQQYHHWHGRTLAVLGDTNDALTELELARDLCGPDDACSEREILEILKIRSAQGEPSTGELADIIASLRNEDAIAQARLFGTMGAIVRAERTGVTSEAGKRELRQAIELAQLALPGLAYRYKGHATLCMSYAILGEYQLSLSEAELWLRDSPRGLSARSWAMKAARNLQRWDVVIEHGLAIEEPEPDVQYLLGLALSASGRSTEALPYLEAAVNRGWDQARYLLAIELVSAVQRENETTIAAIPGPPSAEHLRLLELALHTLQTGTVTEPLVPKFVSEIQNSLAYAYVQRGENLELATTYAQRSLAHEWRPEVADTLGWILTKSAEASLKTPRNAVLREAKGLFEAALTKLPQDEAGARAEALYHLAYLERLQGGTGRARALVVEAIHLKPSYAEAQQLLTEILKRGPAAPAR